MNSDHSEIGEVRRKQDRTIRRITRSSSVTLALVGSCIFCSCCTVSRLEQRSKKRQLLQEEPRVIRVGGMI